MKAPFVSRAAYDAQVRLADAAERHAEKMEQLAADEGARSHLLVAKIRELTDAIIGMKRLNFVVETPVTHEPLSVDEADELEMAESEEARAALLKRKF